MLLRKDLAKEFELVVKQEIKNFQDLSSEILESIRNLKNSHSSLQDDLNRKYASLHSVTSSHESEIKESKESFRNNLMNAIHNTNVLEKKFDILKEMVVFVKKESEENRENVINLLTELLKQKEIIDELQKMIVSFKRDCDQSINSSFLTLRNEMKELDQSYRDKPCTCLPETTSLKTELSSHCVDVIGISKMMKILQKEMMINDKKIEAVHMLLKKEV